jgi:hypothetical protein
MTGGFGECCGPKKEEDACPAMGASLAYYWYSNIHSESPAVARGSVIWL